MRSRRERQHSKALRDAYHYVMRYTSRWPFIGNGIDNKFNSLFCGHARWRTRLLRSRVNTISVFPTASLILCRSDFWLASMNEGNEKEMIIF